MYVTQKDIGLLRFSLNFLKFPEEPGSLAVLKLSAFFITFVHETAAAAADFGVKSSNIAQTALGLPGPERPRRPKKTSRCDSTYATYAIFPDNLRTVRVRYFAVR